MQGDEKDTTAAAASVTWPGVEPLLIALLFCAAALSELAQLALWATGGNSAPAALNLARIPPATAAVLTAVGAWRARPWA